jgi:ribosomal small subunit protein bTHX
MRRNQYTARRYRIDIMLGVHLGKGDMKTRRGKIYRGSFGKRRPKQPQKGQARGKTGSSASGKK